jgi:ABC-type lipoprotein export system ATPase subunit
VQELRLRDFALVPSAAVAFSPGLVAISGQSGAGKSVLLDVQIAVTDTDMFDHCLRGHIRCFLIEQHCV